MDEDHAESSLFELYDVREGIEKNLLCVIGKGWMGERKKNK